METLQQFKSLQTVNDKWCHIYFEKLLQAKVNITLGLVIDYPSAISAIRYIESKLDHLKYFIGFMKTKRLILEKYRDVIEE